jgi:7-cyano-7-deazaguanine synthase in queuosine biosynthesis
LRKGGTLSTLAMLSGGLDSTAMVVKLLTETDDELRVHHIRLANREGRADAEEQAVRRIVQECARRYRSFRYSESGLDFTALEAIPIDYMAVAYVACQVAIDTPGCNRIAVGTLAGDTDEVNRSRRQRQVFAVMHDCYRARRLGEPQVEWIYPVHALGKPELARLLPGELLALTWSCRRPLRVGSGYAACGNCKACRARGELPLAPRVAAERQLSLSPARPSGSE